MAESKIVDYLGRPIKTSELTKELAEPSMMGIRQVWYDSVASGLTPERLAGIIIQVDQNDIIEYLTLAEEMEEREPHYRSVLSTRKNAVSGLGIMVESFSDDPEDQKIAEFVDEVVQADAFDKLVTSQLDALGKSYAVSEIIWEHGEQFVPKQYKWRDPRHFQFDQDTGDELRLRDEENLVDGLPLEPGKFVVHRPELKSGITIRGGLARLVAVSYMCKGYTIKDWMAFMEVFGMPLRLGKYDEAASSRQKATLLSAVAQIGTDAAAIIPDSMVIEFIEAAKTSGSDKLFMGAADWFDRQTSKAVLGQVASTEGTPGRLGGDDEQGLVRQDIKISDAKQLSTTLRRDLVKPLVDLNFKPRPHGQYPKLRIVIEEPEDLESLAKSLSVFVDRGLRVQSSVILDKFNIAEAEEGAEVLQPKGGGSPAVDDDDLPPGGEPEDKNTDTDGDEKPPEPESQEDELQREKREAASEIMGMVRRGDALTADQRQMLVAIFATATERHKAAAQTLVLSKKTFKTKESAAGWAADRNYSVTKMYETENSWSFRQRHPVKFQPNSFRTIDITTGAKAVVGRLKTETAATKKEDSDEIDRLVEQEIDGWREYMDPVLNPILDLAKASGNYEQFLAGLEKAMAKMDTEKFIERVSTSTFKARGLGDATDDL